MTHFLVCVFLGKHEKCVASLLGLTPTKFKYLRHFLCCCSKARPSNFCSTPCCTDTNFSTCVLEQNSKFSSFYVAARRLDGSTGQFCMRSWPGKKKKLFLAKYFQFKSNISPLFANFHITYFQHNICNLNKICPFFRMYLKVNKILIYHFFYVL